MEISVIVSKLVTRPYTIGILSKIIVIVTVITTKKKP
jgi:hypothetical protein